MGKLTKEVSLTYPNPPEVKFQLRGRRPRAEPKRRRIV